MHHSAANRTRESENFFWPRSDLVRTPIQGMSGYAFGWALSYTSISFSIET